MSSHATDTGPTTLHSGWVPHSPRQPRNKWSTQCSHQFWSLAKKTKDFKPRSNVTKSGVSHKYIFLVFHVVWHHFIHFQHFSKVKYWVFQPLPICYLKMLFIFEEQPFPHHLHNLTFIPCFTGTCIHHVNGCRQQLLLQTAVTFKVLWGQRSKKRRWKQIEQWKNPLFRG